jgi:serine protease Do
MKITKSMMFGMLVGFVFVVTMSFYLQSSLQTCEAQAQPAKEAQKLAPITNGVPDEQDVAMIERMSRVFRYVSKSVSESVVHITSQKMVKGLSSENPFGDEDMLRRFFPDERFFRSLPSRPEPQVGLGSGVIIGSDGLIVTNNHVVDDADKISIVLPDGREVSPVWVRKDAPTDIALIKVDVKGLKPLVLADSNSVDVGDFVLAVGNPFGLDKTVTQGIVSYIGRGVRINNASPVSYNNYIQTDAAINPGNSGGPLVNLRGQVIGINSAIVTRTASFAGIGFAIPSNTVSFVVDQLKTSEQVVRSYLGVSIQDMSLPLARNFGLDRVEGALISDVGPDTPASKAGMKAGDIVLELDGQKILTSQQLQNIVSQTPPGREVKATIWRDKKQLVLTIKLEKMPKAFLAGKMGPGSQAAPESGDKEEQVTIEELGIAIGPITPDLAKKYNYKPNMKGVVITQIDPQGVGAQNGLSEGDLILQVQNQPVNSVQEFKNVLKKASFKEGVTLFARSVAGNARFIYIKID